MNRLFACIVFILFTLIPVIAKSYQSANTTIDWENLPGRYSIQNYTVTDGLPINSVSYLSSSKAGYLYLATNDGLSRFDGQTFKVYNTFNSPTLRSNRIAWVGSFGDELWFSDDRRNVYRLRNGEILCLQDIEGLEKVEGYKIARYDDQTILITTNAGFYTVNVGEFKFNRFEDPRTYVHFNNSFSFGRDSVYFIDDNGLHRIKDEKVRLLKAKNEFSAPLELVFNMVPTKSGVLWLLGDSGWLTEIAPNKKPNSYFLAEGVDFRDAIELDDTDLLLSTSKGYYYFDRLKKEFRRSEYVSNSEPYFEDNAWISSTDELITVFDNSIFINRQMVLKPTRSISYLMRDNEGAIWVATNGGGIYQIRKNKLITIGERIHPKLENTYGVIEQDGKIWVSAFNNYLFSISNNEVVHWDDNSAGFNQPFFRTLEVTSKGDIYAGNFDLWRKIETTWQRVNFSDKHGLINVLFEDSNERLWIGTEHGLYVQSKGQIQPFFDLEAMQIGSVQYITETKAGTLLFATKELGVAVLPKSGKFKFVNTDKGLSSNIVRDAAMFGTDTLWVATEDKGLNRVIFGENFEVRSISGVTTNDGLIDNSLHRLILDDYGYLWINSNLGIMRIKFSSLNAYLDGNDRLEFQNFNEVDGLINSEGNGGAQNAGLITTDGRLIFPNQAGLVYTRPEWHLENKYSNQGRIIIEEIKAADSVYTHLIGSDISLPKRVRELSINFTLPTFSAQDKIEFEYKLDGVNVDWVSVGNERNAIFSNLPSGRHSLHIRGHIRGFESIAETSVAIVVPALFHETPLFIVLVIIGLMGAFIGFLKMAMYRAKMREERLNELVDERTEQVVLEKEKTEQALKKLEELSESKSRFFTNFTHELRTPLTLILNPLEDIIQKRTESTSINNKSLLLVQRNALRLKKLVNTLLDVSKLSANELSITFSAVNIVEVTTQIAAQFEHELIKKKISFTIEANRKNTKVFVDVNAWDHICTNLLSNAIKFTKPNGEISIKILAQNHQVTIAFSDSGIGIPESDLSHIFDIYYQVDSQITRSGGTGIGLTLVKGFVEKLKGEIHVRSVVGQGTCFEIKLPTGNAHLTNEDNVVDYQSMPMQQSEFIIPNPSFEETITNENNLRRIVLVEDNDDMREYIAHVISSEYHVKTATNGKEGLKVIEAFAPELIVSDIMMPEMDGIEMMKTIRKIKNYKHIPFVFLTAKDSAADIQKGLNLGADVYLTKPIDNNALLLQIKVLLRREAKVTLSDKEKTEHPLIKEVTSVIARHLGNPDLSVELLAEALAMSESTLYRKWKKVSSVTINKTIARLRFEEAMKLVQEEDLSISEAAFAVGFSHLSYFSSAFKKEYGVSPQEYFK